MVLNLRIANTSQVYNVTVFTGRKLSNAITQLITEVPHGRGKGATNELARLSFGIGGTYVQSVLHNHYSYGEHETISVAQ